MTLFLKTSQSAKEYRDSAVRGQDFSRISSGPTNTAQFNESLSKRFSPDTSTEYTGATSDTQNGNNRTLKGLVYALTVAVLLLLLFQERMDNELSNAFKRIAELEQRK